MKQIKMPAGLQAPGKKFWKEVMGEYKLEMTHDLERLRQACRCLDEIKIAEVVIKKDGLFIEDRFKQKREHPAAKLIRDNKTLFCRIIRELCLDVLEPGENRPPRLY